MGAVHFNNVKIKIKNCYATGLIKLEFGNSNNTKPNIVIILITNYFLSIIFSNSFFITSFFDGRGAFLVINNPFLSKAR